MTHKPFALTCLICDAGDGIDSVAEAIALGWTKIHEENVPPDGFWWTHVGVCAECGKNRSENK